MVWMFPIISSLFLMIAYIIIKSSFHKIAMTFMLFFIGCTGTLNLAGYLRILALKLGAESIDVSIPILENIKFKLFSFRLTFLNFL